MDKIYFYLILFLFNFALSSKLFGEPPPPKPRPEKPKHFIERNEIIKPDRPEGLPDISGNNEIDKKMQTEKSVDIKNKDKEKKKTDSPKEPTEIQNPEKFIDKDGDGISDNVFIIEKKKVEAINIQPKKNSKKGFWKSLLSIFE